MFFTQFFLTPILTGFFAPMAKAVTHDGQSPPEANLRGAPFGGPGLNAQWRPFDPEYKREQK
jgi:hypothetical protein